MRAQGGLYSSTINTTPPQKPCRAATQSGEIGDTRDTQIHGNIPSRERRAEAQFFGYLIQIFLSHCRPLALIAPLGAAGCLSVSSVLRVNLYADRPLHRQRRSAGTHCIYERAARTHKNAHHMPSRLPYLPPTLVKPCSQAFSGHKMPALALLVNPTGAPSLPECVSAKPWDGIKV